jgi:hypothetical protein
MYWICYEEPEFLRAPLKKYNKIIAEHPFNWQRNKDVIILNWKKLSDYDEELADRYDLID